MNIKDILFELSSADSLGSVTEARDKAFSLLSEFAECEKCDNLSVIGRIKGKSDYTLMLDAHIDEIGFVVTDIDDKGFLTLQKCGGFDLRSLPAKTVTVHAKEKLRAVFASTPPHLSSGEKEYTDITEIKLDSLLGARAKEIVSVGDFVSFNESPRELLGSRVTGKAFDDRAGVACLIELARRLKGKDLPINVCFLLSDMEELGLRGAKTASFKVNPDEAIAIDVSFGDGIGISSEECGRLGKGAMIGFSPVLDKRISKSLTEIAVQKEIPYQTEVMGGKTGTNGDIISLTREGVRTGLLSIPLRNMHSCVEVLDIDDLVSVCDILEQYILKGGDRNA